MHRVIFFKEIFITVVQLHVTAQLVMGGVSYPFVYEKLQIHVSIYKVVDKKEYTTNIYNTID